VSELQKMMKRTEKVDYDMELYANDLQNMLNKFPKTDSLRGKSYSK
jgi:hypothetical protein